MVRDSVLVSWIPPMARQEVCPQGSAATPPPTPTCGGVAFEGFCWYLPEVVGDTCQAICEAEGLAVYTAVDTGGNFWDVHDAASCRSLFNRVAPSNGRTVFDDIQLNQRIWAVRCRHD